LAMEARGFEVMNAESVFNAIVQINLRAPGYAVADLRLGDGYGLDVISALKERQPDAHAAVKLGAVDYLTKPSDINDIISILLAPKGVRTDAPSRPMSTAQVRWKHILQVHESCAHNVSETSRRLKMRRRTLQRILSRSRTFRFGGVPD